MMMFIISVLDREYFFCFRLFFVQKLKNCHVKLKFDT